MKKHLIAIQSGDWYDESNDEKSIALAKECGVEALDFNIDHVISPNEYVKGKKFPLCDLPTEAFVEKFLPLKAASEKYGICFSQMHAPFPLWFEGKEAETEYLLGVTEKCIAVCDLVGAPAIVVHPYFTDNREKDRKINLKMYRRLMPTAKKYGVKICLENVFKCIDGKMYDCLCSTAEESCELIDILNAEAGEDIFGFCFDVGHANLLGKDMRAFLNTLGKRLTVLHIHDNNGRGDQHMIPYTQTKDVWGATPGTDWESFFLGLRDIGYEGAISFETFRITRHVPKEVLPETLKLITAIGRYFKKRIEE